MGVLAGVYFAGTLGGPCSLYAATPTAAQPAKEKTRMEDRRWRMATDRLAPSSILHPPSSYLTRITPPPDTGRTAARSPSRTRPPSRRRFARRRRWEFPP